MQADIGIGPTRAVVGTGGVQVDVVSGGEEGGLRRTAVIQW